MNSEKPVYSNEGLYMFLIEQYKSKQLIVAIEELSELQKELTKALRGKDNVENIIEEIADVEIMIEQVKLYFNINEEHVKKEKVRKLERLQERIFNDKL